MLQEYFLILMIKNIKIDKSLFCFQNEIIDSVVDSIITNFNLILTSVIKINLVII